MTGADPLAAFCAAIEAAGIKPLEPIASRLGPTLIRFACEGDGRGKRNGWATLFLDGRPAGAFGNYRMQIRERWRLGSGCNLSPHELARWRRDVADRQVKRERERVATQEAVALDCRSAWGKAAPADPSHPYLVRKGVGAEGLRQDGRALLIPMRDELGAIWNTQRVFGDGFKSFAKGARVDGLYWSAGKVTDKLAIGEGFASVAAVRRATGLPVAAAFTSGNLVAVAKLMRAKFPQAQIILAADDDRALVDHPQVKKNVGVAAAVAAANAVGGVVAMPPGNGELVDG